MNIFVVHVVSSDGMARISFISSLILIQKIDNEKHPSLFTRGNLCVSYA